MTYGELKQSILSLGFEVESTIDEEYELLFLDGINRALRFINVEFPMTGSTDFTINNPEDDYETIDFSAFDDFDTLLRAEIKRTVDGRNRILPFADYIDNDGVVRFYTGTAGTITFIYRTRITEVTDITDDDTELVIQYKAEPLLPLLACYYIWNDDDPEKAAKWRNEYEDMKTIIKGEPRKTLSFIGGF